MWSYKTASHLDVQGLFWNPSQSVGFHFFWMATGKALINYHLV